VEAKMISDELSARLRERGYIIRRFQDRIEAVGEEGKVVVFSHGGWIAMKYEGEGVRANLSLNSDEINRLFS